MRDNQPNRGIVGRHASVIVCCTIPWTLQIQLKLKRHILWESVIGFLKYLGSISSPSPSTCVFIQFTFFVDKKQDSLSVSLLLQCININTDDCAEVSVSHNTGFVECTGDHLCARMVG